MITFLFYFVFYFVIGILLLNIAFRNKEASYHKGLTISEATTNVLFWPLIMIYYIFMSS